jgi:hypothetical protein
MEHYIIMTARRLYLQLIAYFVTVETIAELLHLDKVCHSERSWTYVGYRFHLNNFSLTKLLNVAMIRNVEVILGQTLNYAV